MCGIVGYVGPQDATEVILEGLRRLEYRGYDSAGVVVVNDGALVSDKKAGKLVNLIKSLAENPMPFSGVGMGHTRWATHGAPTDRNAHPHFDDHHQVAVVHNGIIENYVPLRALLEAAGHEFTSDTDTEVTAHLLAVELAVGMNLADAMRAICRRLEGAFTLVAVSAADPNRVVAARQNSPLVVGLGNGENFLGSDVSAFIGHTREAMEIDEGSVVDLHADSVTVTDFEGHVRTPRRFTVTWDASAAEKGGHATFMHKEITEQPQAIADTLRGRIGADGRLQLDEMRLSDDELRVVDKIIIVACGTAYHAGLVAKYAIEHWTRVPCEVEYAHEFRYRDPILTRSTLVIAISQSGETMDTLMAVRHARQQRARVLAVCNVNGATIPREADAVLYTHAGPEVAVASTKAFLTQIVAVYLVGLYLAQVQGTKYGDEIRTVLDDLAAMPDKVQIMIDRCDVVTKLAHEMAGARVVLFLGRHAGFPVALEGALKLKELAYIHAEGFAAGELKHGPIALVEPGLPVFVVVPSPIGRAVLHDKIVSNIAEIRARGATTIVLAEEGDEAVRQYADVLLSMPVAPTLMLPLLATVPLQMFACELATAKGLDVDQPRNLAKSVTVE